MGQFKVDDEVNVKIEVTGTVTFVNNDSYDIEYELPDGQVRVIEYVEPRFMTTNNWPPRLGDVWEVDGNAWLVRKHMFDSGRVVLTPTDGVSSPLDEGEFKDRSPVLVYRRGQ